MARISIKPLSANRAWYGRRFPSNDYHQYKKDLAFILPKMIVPEGNLKLTVTFAYSNTRSDIDNGLKAFVDVLQENYGFNDNRIYELEVYKRIVKKGKEYIDFLIEKC